MDQSAIDGTRDRSTHPLSRLSSNGLAAWVIGILNGLAIAACIGGAAAYGHFQMHVKREDCLLKTANDPHTLMEAFFQNPPAQNALILMRRVCSN